MMPRAIQRVKLGVTSSPKNILIQVGSVCSSCITCCCCCCPGKGTTGLCQQREEHHTEDMVGNGHVFAMLQSSFMVVLAPQDFYYSPNENWLRHFTSHLNRKEYHFLSRLLYSLPLFICRGISNLGPNTQILLIYF